MIRTVLPAAVIVKKGAAILDITEEDHLNRWGCHQIQERSALRGEHLTLARCVLSLLASCNIDADFVEQRLHQ
jgi:hypothetical protein